MADTHYGSLVRNRVQISPDLTGTPVSPQEGDVFFDILHNRNAVYYEGKWWYQAVTTTTSTSSSTTTTSTSTTTTSTSTTTTTSTSTSTSTSTTTTV